VNVRETGQDIYENIFNFIEAPNNDESTDLNKATFSSKFVEKLLKIYAKENDIILDTFMGTGTTAIGCINMSMNFIGFELSEAQCDYAKRRISNRTAQCGLFDVIDYEEEKHLEGMSENE
jgi:DNA modification methylase